MSGGSESIFDGSEPEHVHLHVERGIMFEAGGTLSVANAGGVEYMLFQTGHSVVVIHGRDVSPEGDDIEYDVFESPGIISVGTLVPIYSRNRIKSAPTASQLFVGPVVSDVGTQIAPTLYMPGTTAGGQKSSGHFSTDGAIRILKPNTRYLCRVKNGGALNPSSVGVYFLWAEFDKPISYGE